MMGPTGIRKQVLIRVIQFLQFLNALAFGLNNLLVNSPLHGDNLVTVLGNGLLDGDGLGNLDSTGDLHDALLVDNLGHGHLNLLDLVGANGDANGVGHHDGLGATLGTMMVLSS
jgi:hypothetical protein